MKKILFVVTMSFVATSLLAQQPKALKKNTKASTKKTEVVEPKKEVEVKKEAEVKKIMPTPAPNVQDPNATQGMIMPGMETALPMPVKAEAPAPVVPQQTAPAAPPQDVNKVFSFTNDNYDFGKIVAGKAAEYTLSIKNISKEEATLTLVQPTCGCTTPKYEAGKKFAPGEEVKVVLGFNGGSPGQAQQFSKTVTITLNGNITKSVSFRGETYPAPAESAPANGAMDKLKPGN